MFVFEQDGYTIALPLLVRRVEEKEGWCDATSVYGYAGPITSHAEVPAATIRDFQQALQKTLAERKVIALFSRLHPLLPQRALLAGLGECRPCGQTVSIDLTLPPDVQRTQFSASVKRRLNKLRRDGVTCERDVNRQQLAEFVGLYHETMLRVGAQRSYFFDESYFTQLAEALGPGLQLFVVNVNGRLASGGLFTLCDGIAQYHLGGTRDEFLPLSPMALVMDTARLWAWENGARVLHLGGGVGAREDSLFQFKAGFSDRRHSFATWRWMIDAEAYAALTEDRQRWNEERGLKPISADYFPAYRCPALPREEARPEALAAAASWIAAASELPL
jgi:hypothetical protein